jgi:hypothetical protein
VEESLYKRLVTFAEVFAGGFVLENEPTGEVFLRGSVAANTTMRRLVGLGFENEPTGRGI